MNTKISFFVTFLLLISRINISAQQKVYGGFKMSSNYTVFTDNAENWKSQIGYGIGYHEIMELNDYINLQAEIILTTYSFNKKSNSGSTSYEQNQIFRSIEIPMMIKYRLSANSAVGLGYQYCFLKSGKEKIILSDGTNNTETKTNNSGVNTSGIFLDFNTKSKKMIYGIRLNMFQNEFIETKKSVNSSIYLGYNLF
ncbi:MAG: hypothetical protein RIR96_1503 [Bacteroidota bacterium]|jgi:hypothetical protein